MGQLQNEEISIAETKLTLVQCLERQLPPAPGGDEVWEGYREL